MQCPYCGVDVTQPPEKEESIFKGFASPFQNAPKQDIPQPPYRQKNKNEDLLVTKEEWNIGNKNDEKVTEEEDASLSSAKREMIALLLLLPGVVFFLFGLILVLFPQMEFFFYNGTKTLPIFTF